MLAGKLSSFATLSQEDVVASTVILQQRAGPMPTDWTGIIQTASKSPLGILALMILMLRVVGYFFFKDADAKIKAAMYLAMLGGVIGYGEAISRATSNTGSESYRVRVMVMDTHRTGVEYWTRFVAERV